MRQTKRQGNQEKEHNEQIKTPRKYHTINKSPFGTGEITKLTKMGLTKK